MNVQFPPDIRQFIESEIESGNFENESQIIVCALELYREMTIRHAELREQVQLSLAQADRGELAPFDIEEIKAELAQLSALRRSEK